MLNVALLGAGRIGQIHAENIYNHPKAQLKYVVDPLSCNAKIIASKTNAKQVDLQTVISCTDIDAVIIATPTRFHVEIIEKLSATNKAIFCEKPISTDISKLRSCLSLVNNSKQIFMVGFNRRFDPNFMSLRQSILDDHVGELYSLTITSRDPAPPSTDYLRSSGGLFVDMMIHDFDMLNWLLGEQLSTLYAIGSNKIIPNNSTFNDIDNAVVTIKSKSGILCTINNCRQAKYGYDQRIEILGSKGMLIADNIRENSVTYSGVKGTTLSPNQNFFLDRYAVAYKNEIDCFIQSCISKRMPSVTTRDAIHALSLANFATKSFKSNQIVNLSPLYSKELVMDYA